MRTPKMLLVLLSVTVLAMLGSVVWHEARLRGMSAFQLKAEITKTEAALKETRIRVAQCSAAVRLPETWENIPVKREVCADTYNIWEQEVKLRERIQKLKQILEDRKALAVQATPARGGIHTTLTEIPTPPRAESPQ